MQVNKEREKKTREEEGRMNEENETRYGGEKRGIKVSMESEEIENR